MVIIIVGLPNATDNSLNCNIILSCLKAINLIMEVKSHNVSNDYILQSVYTTVLMVIYYTTVTTVILIHNPP